MKRIKVILEGIWIVERIVLADEVEKVIEGLLAEILEGTKSLRFNENTFINPSKIVAIEVNEVPND